MKQKRASVDRWELMGEAGSNEEEKRGGGNSWGKGNREGD